MPESIYSDPFATKGIEYLLVIAFLLAFLWYWRVLSRPTALAAQHAGAAAFSPSRWFQLPAGLFYHPGHSWACLEGGDVVRIGMDDFAQKLIGRASAVRLPEVGSRVGQGERGWMLDVASKTLSVLSPVDGEVIARNEAALRSPSLVSEDPYGDGWLIKVKASRLKANLKGLLHGKLADMWMDMTEQALRQKVSSNVGLVLQDGGAPVSGIALNLSDEDWDRVAEEFLLSD